MVLSYHDFGAHDIFDDNEDMYDLNYQFQFAQETPLGCLQSDSVFDKDGEEHNITITKELPYCMVEFNTNDGVKVSSEKIVSNVDMGFALDREKVSVSEDYQTENWRTESVVDSTRAGHLSFTNETVISSGGISVGFGAKISKNFKINDYSAAVNWQVDENSTYTAKMMNKCNQMVFTCVKKVSTDLEVAGRLEYDSSIEATDLSFGAKFPIFGGLSHMLIAREGTKLLYSNKLSDNVSAGLSLNIPVKGGLAGITHGFRLAFS